MDNMQMENIIKSFFLGLFIGMILQLYDGADVPLPQRTLSVLASGSIGFLIGFATEWLTSKLPARMANSRLYFFINNLIALLVATCLLGVLALMADGTTGHETAFMPVLWIVLGIISIANLFDYWMYRRAQRNLQTYQARMREKFH